MTWFFFHEILAYFAILLQNEIITLLKFSSQVCISSFLPAAFFLHHGAGKTLISLLCTNFIFSLKKIAVGHEWHHVKSWRKQRLEAAVFSFMTEPGSSCEWSCWWPPGNKNTATSPRCTVGRVILSPETLVTYQMTVALVLRRAVYSLWEDIVALMDVSTWRREAFFSLIAQAFVIFITSFPLQHKQTVRWCLSFFSVCVLTGWVVSHLQQHTLLLPLLPPLPSLFPLLTK